ncbi:sulfur carrier protein ThiS [Candidatus Williamhamiltonella defendens]|uniref:sulfur carrier protein ThiS n=1 Tax=Candidatus Williamhamiltonella defendens TaxID=138072 RepID=UPI00130E100E|nr:sulfur carrier protein ThiS [Candidatus Hamiltonella defensa]
MRITFNDRPLELAKSMTLDAMLTRWYGTASGSALAVNQTIIPRQHWPEYQLQDGDEILLFQVIAGG